MHMPLEQNALIFFILKVTQYIVDWLRYDTFAAFFDISEHAHRISLTSSSLTINKIGAVVSLQDAIHKWLACPAEYLILSCRIREYLVESEVLHHFLWNAKLYKLGPRAIGECALPLSWVLMTANNLAGTGESRIEDGIINLVLKRWSHSYKDLYIFRSAQ